MTLRSDGSKEARLLVEALMKDHSAMEALRIIYNGRNQLGVTADGHLCVKSFRRPGLLRAIIYTFFRKPKALKAFDNGVRLVQMGISTPTPRAAATCRTFCLLSRSYYVCDYIEGWEQLRGVQDRPDFGAIASALAAFVHRLISRGVVMHDLSPGNVLYRQLSDSSYAFTLVDINRMSFGVTSRRKLMKQFGRILDTAAAVDVLAEAYAALDRAHPDVADTIRKIYAREQRSLNRHRRIKSMFKRTK